MQVAAQASNAMVATIQPTQTPDTPLHHGIPKEEHEEVLEQRSVEETSNKYGSNDKKEQIIEKQQSAPTGSTRSESAAGTLRPLKKLYGRDNEIDIIREEYCRAMNVEAHNSNEANLVVIRGADGVGKTSVALSIQDTVIKDDGFILNWKFDPLNTMETETTFTDGFEDLCRQICKSSEETQHKLREAIRAAGPVDCATLLEMIPCLKAIIGNKERTAGGVKTAESRGKHMEVLTGFLNCFRKANVPLVILVDDITGFDPSSCLQLTQIITSFTAGGVLCLATLGPDESVDSIVMNSAEKLRITDLALENIQEDQLNAMVADMLHVTKDISVPMTKFLYHHSRGNPMFAMELLRLMVDTRILKYDVEQKTWNCEEPQTDFVNQCRDFDGLMGYKLSCAAPGELLELLKVASCFGNKVDVRLLEVAMDSSPMCQLKIATSLDWLRIVDEEKGTYRFAHSGLRRGAYGLIPKEERESLHVVIARRLLQKLDDRQRHKYVSVILGQIRMGIACLDDQAERAMMAGVCLEGAEKALEWSGFIVAFECLKLGISLLGENGWRDHYDLALALYNSAAECGHTMGSFSEALELVDVVLRNARVFDHKLQAYFTQLYILVSKHDNNTALRVGVEVLGQLGVDVPFDPSPMEVKREATSLLRFMKDKTPERLLRLPNMTDKRMASAMQIANLIITSAPPHWGALLVLRAMRITVTHGLCAISSFIFGLYGSFVCGRLENVDEGTRYGDAALQLLDRFNAREWAPRVYVAVYGCVYVWTKDIRYCIEQLRRAQSIGLETGDNYFAMFSGNIRLTYMMALGEPLPLIEKEFEISANELKMLNQTAMTSVHRPFQETIKALTRDPDDRNENPQQALEGSCSVEQEGLMGCWQNYLLSLVAYFQEDYARAVDLADKGCAMEMHSFKTLDLSTFHMVRALSHIANYRASGKGKRKALGIARSYTKRFRVLSEDNPRFCVGMMHLLQAEIFEVTKKKRGTHHLFVTAAACFDSENMMMGHAISKELAGRYMLQCGKKGVAQEYLEESVELYGKWGSLGKQKLLQQDLERVGKVGSERNGF